MLRRLRTLGTAGLLLSLLSPGPARAREIELGDVKITAPGERTGQAALTPWSGQWWPMSDGKLALGWNGTGADFTYDQAAKRYTRATSNKPASDRSPLLKFDAWREALTGRDPGSALVELHGEGSFRHHVHGEEKERLDREGTSYSWWGHCNGWCATSILVREPQGPVEARGIRFDVADLKGLLSESHYGVESDFTGRRFNAPPAATREARDEGKRLLAALTAGQPAPVGEYVAWYEKAYSTTMSDTARRAAKPADFKGQLEGYERWYADRYDAAYADLAPHVFHQILEAVIGQRRLALVFDVDAGAEVWNHPAYAFTSNLERVRTFSEGGAQRTEWRARTVVTYGTDGVSASILGVEAFTRTYTYTLVTDAQGKPLSGAWTGASVDDHPDFAWLPTRNAPGADSSENPRMRWDELSALLPGDHAPASARPFDLAADGVLASGRRQAGATTTWGNPVATGADVVLGVRPAQGQAVARVVYFEQAVELQSGYPVARRVPLTRLGEGTNGPRFEATARLAAGKRMVLAYGYAASGKLLGIDELVLDVGGRPAPAPADDAFEPNGTPATATRLGPGVHRDLVCNDDDHYRVTLASAGDLTVAVDFRNAEGDLDLVVTGPSGEVGRSQGTTDQERVVARGLPAGDYVARVYGYAGARARYALTIETTTSAPTPGPTPAPGPTPGDDRFEPNNARAQAAALPLGVTQGLACNDDDWFRVTLPAAGSLTVSITFRHADGDLDLAVTNAAGAAVGESTSATDGERVHKTGLAAGDYFVRVHGYRGARAPYAIEVQTTPSGGVTPTPTPTPTPTLGTGTITASVLNVRRGPGTTHAIATTLANGRVVTIHEERAGWLRVTWSGAPSGELWVSGSYVRR